MSKSQTPPPYGLPPTAPPGYTQCVSGVPPTNPCIPQHASVQRGRQILTTAEPLGKEPTRMICRHCHAEIDTSTTSEPGAVAYLVGSLICLVCPYGCCLIPFCMEGCRDTNHYCPNCKAYLGRYQS